MLALRIQNPSPLPAGTRLREIDELKGWAMLLVILYHTGGVLGWSNWFHGEVGVDVFLAISGFTLARSSGAMSAGQFIRRRLARIFPAYWLALALFLFLSFKFYEVSRSGMNVGLHILGLHGFAFTEGVYFSDINDSFWFISLILLMYGAFLCLRSRLADPAWVLGFGFLLTVVLAIAYIKTDHGGGLSHLAARIPCFFMGLAAGRVSLAPVTEFTFNPVFIGGVVAVTGLGWMTGFFPFCILAAPAAIMIFFFLRRTLVRHPDGRFALGALALLGVYSYEIFLFHQPLIRDYNSLIWARYILRDHMPTKGQLALGVLAGLVVTFAISYVVHTAIGWLFSSRTPGRHGRAVSA